VTVGEDGFTYYVCAECGNPKLAALFLPSEIAKAAPMCRACMGEVGLRVIKVRESTKTMQWQCHYAERLRAIRAERRVQR
jgi:hypothetical protein